MINAGSRPATPTDDLAAHTNAGRFVTGQLMRIDLDTETGTIVNAGHPLPLRVRDGRIEEVELDVDLPFGIRRGREFRMQKLPLEPGDRIASVTDGMLKRNAARLDVSAASSVTTPPCCAWTGTAGHGEHETP